MRITFCCWLLLAATTASATGPSWPIRVDVTYPPTVGPEGGRAAVTVAVDQDATDVRLEIHGDDGMRVEPDNKLVLRVESMRAGESRRFDVAFRPGPGRSYLAVASHARFPHTEGGAVLDFPFGAESPAQLAEHHKCVMQDAEGTWIHLMGCEEETAAPATPAVAPPTAQPTHAVEAVPLGDVVALRREARPGLIVEVAGYVVDAYRCAPCPKGAMCKPCEMASAIFIADAPQHPRFSWSVRPADVAAVAADDPNAFSTGVRYRFEVRLESGGTGAVDATLLRAERADGGPTP
jgi:hypothetical protein